MRRAAAPSRRRSQLRRRELFWLRRHQRPRRGRARPRSQAGHSRRPVSAAAIFLPSRPRAGRPWLHSPKTTMIGWPVCPTRRSQAPQARSPIGATCCNIGLSFPQHAPATQLHALAAFIAGTEHPQLHCGAAVGNELPIAFVYSGNGGQWAGMGISAYRQNARFRAHFDNIDDHFRQRRGLVA